MQDDEAYYSDDFELEECEEISNKRLSPVKQSRRPPSRLAVPPTPPHLVRAVRTLAGACSLAPTRSDGLSGTCTERVALGELAAPQPPPGLWAGPAEHRQHRVRLPQ
jgi:hypothetical protein